MLGLPKALSTKDKSKNLKDITMDNQQETKKLGSSSEGTCGY
jgi:hypothetical protein